MKAAYIIGQPGAGKSTLVHVLTRGLPYELRLRPFAHLAYMDPADPEARRVVAKQLGGHDPKFPGTDRLSMSVQPEAVAWVQGAPAPVVFGEGDRLSTEGFLTALRDAADEGFTLLWLDTPDALATARCEQRGSRQSAAWVKGRRTKVARLAKQLGAVHLDGSQPLSVLAEHCWAASPALAQLAVAPHA